MRISIVIPIYNVTPYIRECLNSILAQSYDDWEAICVNDGSTDESAKILDEYALKDPRIKVYHKTNGGVSSARNKGILEACGKWILFLDGDDLFGKDLLGEVASAIRTQVDADIVGFDLCRLEPDGKVVQGEESDPMKCGFCQFAYRKGFIEGMSFPAYGMGEDRVFTFRALAKKPKIVTIDYLGYYYRMREGSATHSDVYKRVTFSTIRYHFDMARLALRIECSMKERARWVWYLVKTVICYVKCCVK